MSPAPEGYCGTCFKMVHLRPGYKAALEIHYTFHMVSHSVDANPRPCTGTTARTSITHGMDDPKAAFV